VTKAVAVHGTAGLIKLLRLYSVDGEGIKSKCGALVE